MTALMDGDWTLVTGLTRRISQIEGDSDDPRAMEAALAIMAGCPSRVFWFMDEHVETIGYEVNGEEWHYRLRSVRNHPVIGRRLLDSLTHHNPNRKD